MAPAWGRVQEPRLFQNVFPFTLAHVTAFQLRSSFLVPANVNRPLSRWVLPPPQGGNRCGTGAGSRRRFTETTVFHRHACARLDGLNGRPSPR